MPEELLVYCPACAGSGEGYGPGTRCSECKGIGEMSVIIDEEAEEEDKNDE